MKTNRLLAILIVIILTSCKNTNDVNLSVLTTLKGESGFTYNESLEQWIELKSKNGNSYIYQTVFVSWAGFGNTTELKVEEGIVVSRAYQEFTTDATTGEQEITETYSETKGILGSHEKGAKPLTIDELYESCAREYLTVDKDSNTIYFEATSEGLMNLCGFVPKGCMDDCFSGVRIDSFEWIE